jgi:predicted PurR-regulated permease PerM
MANLDWGRLRDQCVVALSAIALIWVASQVIGRVIQIVIVVLLAAVLAYALEPPLAWASRILPRGVAAILIYAVAVGVLAIGVLLIGPPTITQTESLAARLPGYISQLSTFKPFGINVAQSLASFAQSALGNVLSVVATVASGVVNAALVLILGFWFMVSGRQIGDLIPRAFPARQRDQVRFVQDTVSQVLGAYIRGQLTMALIIGLSSGVGSWILGVHYPVVIGILAFFFELIPMVGPILASIPAIAISLTQPFPLVIYVIVFFVVMQVVENNVLAPSITGGAVGLHPAIALLAVVVGADLGGVAGALFAVPVAGIASVLIAAVWNGWRGEPIAINRAGMRFNVPRKRTPA